MSFQVSGAQLALAVGLVLVGAGASWGVMTWIDRMPVAGAPATESALGGPVIPGLCVLSRQAVFDASAAGKAANAQFKNLRETAQAAVNGEQAKLVGDAKTLEGQKASLSADQYQARQQDLAKRLQVLRLEASQDSNDLEATRQDVVVRLAKEVQPVIAAVYKERSCGLLVSRDAIMAGNPAMDITAAVVSGLDAKITTIAVERKHANLASH